MQVVQVARARVCVGGDRAEGARLLAAHTSGSSRSCPIVQRWERVPVDTYQRDGFPNWFRNIDDLWLYKHLDTRDAHHENRGYCGLRVRKFE